MENHKEHVMKKITIFLLVWFLLLSLSSAVNATLTTIGTAGYDSDGDGVEESYNLIWDNDNNGSSLIFFDYFGIAMTWTNQMNWASHLDPYLTIKLDPRYNLTWNDDSWRLPNAGFQPYQPYCDGNGSEMGHLLYTELNLTYYPDNAIQNSLNASIFEQLLHWVYWTSSKVTDNTLDYWKYSVSQGEYDIAHQNSGGLGLAIRSGEVTINPVPEPATIFLFGLGLLGLAGVSRKKK